MNQDLHKLKASAMFNGSYDEVTNEQRRYAKTVNFFNIYCKGTTMNNNNQAVVMTVTYQDGSVDNTTYNTANEANEMARQAYRMGALMVSVRHFQ